MVHTVVDGVLRQSNLTNESPEYLAKREELRLAEIELMRQRERVAALRRNLPEGASIQDYEFEDGPPDFKAGDTPARAVRLSELFTKPNRSLVIYQFMFGKKQAKACPMCTAWLDGANGVAHHLAQNLDFAVVAAADLPTLRAYARERGWDKLRLLSAGKNTFKYDLGSEDRKGDQALRFPFLRGTPMVRFVTFTRRIPGCRPKSRSAASICWLRSGISWISRRKAGAIGTPASRMAPKYVGRSSIRGS